MLNALLRRNLEVLERYTSLRERPKSAPPALGWDEATIAQVPAPELPDAPSIEEAAHRTLTHIIYEGARADFSGEAPLTQAAADAALPLEALSEQIQTQSRRYPRVLSWDEEQI